MVEAATLKSILYRTSFAIFFMGNLFSQSVSAVDIVKLSKPPTLHDIRFDYKIEVLDAALKHTQAEFGDYAIQSEQPTMKRSRALDAIISGELVNLYIAPENDNWERVTNVVRIPVRQGVLSYRLLLIHEDDIGRFSELRDVFDLQAFSAGVLSTWTNAHILKAHNLPVIEGNSYNGLFHMLDHHRFNYLMRGVHEIFDELDTRKSRLNNVVIEPSLMFYVPILTYTFVSPAFPRLTARIQKGMETIAENGILLSLFNKYYRKHIISARLSERRVVFLNKTDRTDFEQSNSLELLLKDVGL